MRLYFSVFGAAITLSQLPVTEVLLVLSLAAMFIASFLAIYEDSIERMLAYSSVAQIGYITLGIAIANQSGLTGSIVHILNHAVMKAALFAAIGAVVYRIGTSRLSNLGGLGQVMPLTMAAFVIGGLSIVGVPGTVGFVSKWYLGVGAMEENWWPVVFLMVASSLISVIYIGRVVEVAYFRPVSEHCAKATEPPLSMLLPILLLAAATIYFGFETTWTGDVAGKSRRAATRRAEAMTGLHPSDLILTLDPHYLWRPHALIPVFHRSPNLREGVTIIAAVALWITVLDLVPHIIDGARPTALNFEIVPGLGLAFQVEPLGHALWPGRIDACGSSIRSTP